MFRESPRQTAMRPKKGIFWCPACDGALVWHGQRCPRCGRRDNGHRKCKPSRKLAPVEEE